MDEFSSALQGELGKFFPPFNLRGSDHTDPANESRNVAVDPGDHDIHVGKEVFGCLGASGVLSFGLFPDHWSGIKYRGRLPLCVKGQSGLWGVSGARVVCLGYWLAHRVHL